MKIKVPQQLFITGTDTDIGKTIVAAILTSGLKAAYWKPVQSGLADGTDTDSIKKLTGLPEKHFFPETYRLKNPLSPHAAAMIDGVTIDLERFKLPQSNAFKHLIVEGAGGIMVPLNEKEFMLDLMKKLDLPVLLVSRSTLGTINHTLLSIHILKQNGLNIFGVIMNGPKNPSNREAIEHFGQVPVIAEIEPIENLAHDNLKKIFSDYFIA